MLTPTGSNELIMEVANGAADYRKWNVFVNGGAGNAQSINIRRLNDAGNGGPVDFTINGSNGNILLAPGTSGKVGIGTASPTTRLEINGDTKIVNPNGRSLLIERDNEDSWITFHDPGDVIYSMGIDASESRKFKLNYGSTVGSQTHFVMTSAGDIGIGTASPTAKLDVNGNGKISGVLSVQGNTTLSGNVGIGNASPTAKLDVTGNSKITGDLTVTNKVYADSFVITGTGGGADYVFEPDYRLPTLESIEAYVKAHHHLPEVPSAREMEEKGLNLAAQTIAHLKKIEEMTLHMIELKSENDQLKALIGDLSKRLNALESARRGQLN